MQNCVYVVYRHGSNAANQSLCNKRIVGTVTAGNRGEACRLMARKVTVYRNQHLEAVPFSQLGKTDQRIAYERDLENQAWDEQAREILASLDATEVARRGE